MNHQRRTPLKYTRSSWAVLGLVRFLLAGVVFFAHLRGFTRVPGWISTIIQFDASSAVIAFFLISGVSIGHSYLHSRNGFLKRRFLRIYPLYCVAVLSAMGIAWFYGSTLSWRNTTLHDIGLANSIGNLFMLQGVTCSTVGFNFPLWSINIEVFYYVLTPLFFRLNRSIIVLSISISLYLFTIRMRLLPEVYFLSQSGFWALAWAWLTGFLLARESQTILSCLFVTTGAILIYLSGDKAYGGITIGLTLMTILVAGKLRIPSCAEAFFEWLGDLSYPLYCLHTPICIILTLNRAPVAYWRVITLTLFLTTLFYYIFDVFCKKMIFRPAADHFEKWCAPPLQRIKSKIPFQRLYETFPIIFRTDATSAGDAEQ